MGAPRRSSDPASKQKVRDSTKVDVIHERVPVAVAVELDGEYPASPAISRASSTCCACVSEMCPVRSVADARQRTNRVTAEMEDVKHRSPESRRCRPYALRQDERPLGSGVSLRPPTPLLWFRVQASMAIMAWLKRVSSSSQNLDTDPASTEEPGQSMQKPCVGS